MPQDLVYVAMVESAFKPSAHSRAAAHGFWQFIGGTGRRYGLKKTRAFDERSDPVKSTRAAAHYFRDLYEMFGDWPLAMAAYDAGEGKILKGLQRTGARDYWELRSGGAFLHRETRDYVPYVLAAALISKDPARFGFDVVPDPPMAWETVRVAKPVDLSRVAQAAGVPLEELRGLNSELTTRFTPYGVGAYELRVPPGSAAALAARLGSLPVAPDIAEKRIVVKKGDTLQKVASRAGVTVAELRDFNDLPGNAKLKKGTVLVVPARRPAKGSREAALAGAEAASIAMTIAPRPQGEIRALPDDGHRRSRSPPTWARSRRPRARRRRRRPRQRTWRFPRRGSWTIPAQCRRRNSTRTPSARATTPLRRPNHTARRSPAPLRERHGSGHPSRGGSA